MLLASPLLSVSLMATTAIGTHVPALLEGVPPPPLRSEADAILLAGWDALYDLDYESAERAFRAYQRVDPEAPRGYLNEAATAWLQEVERRQDIEVTRFVDSTHFADDDQRQRDQAVERRIEKLLEKAIGLCEVRLKADADDIDTRYILGSAHGLRAAYEVTVRHRVGPALQAAKRARDEQRRVLAADPEYYDAYLTLGAYDYATGSLPFYARWLALFAGYRGDKNAGIRQLELAARRGATVARDAKAMLTVIYVREGRPSDALPLLGELKDGARHNHVLRLNEAYCLTQLGRYYEAAESYADALRVARRDARFDRAEVALLQGFALLHAGAPESALVIATELLGDAGLEDALLTRAELLAAHAHDSLGQRAEALERYHRVARAADASGSRRAARRAIDTPFRPPSTAPDTTVGAR